MVEESSKVRLTWFDVDMEDPWLPGLYNGTRASVDITDRPAELPLCRGHPSGPKHSELYYRGGEQTWGQDPSRPGVSMTVLPGIYQGVVRAELSAKSFPCVSPCNSYDNL